MSGYKTLKKPNLTPLDSQIKIFFQNYGQVKYGSFS